MHHGQYGAYHPADNYGLDCSGFGHDGEIAQGFHNADISVRCDHGDVQARRGGQEGADIEKERQRNGEAIICDQGTQTCGDMQRLDQETNQ